MSLTVSRKLHFTKIVSAFWLLPRMNQYGGWPASGEIDIMESRGNLNLIDSTGRNIGTKMSSGTLHWGTSTNTNKYQLTHFEQLNLEGLNENWHIYQMEWTQESIIFKIDNQTIGTVTPSQGGFWELGNFENSGIVNPWKSGSLMAPFDQEFYIVINLAVGGTSFFPDNANNPGGKPWSNKSPRASGDFWEGKTQWLPTWKMETNDQSLQVDYVRVWAL
ncbi:hypothetical protein HHI36_019762 [Cryptolaemus montrouzieri]|uniref:GH16 domain-containing protein n=1 Tax=Cryptolaemus montrouzieri TaxID=559131 RepID=A0ABD2N8D4_9CUCU